MSKLNKRGHCTLQGHGTDCEVAHEKTEAIKSMQNRRRRRDERKDIENELKEAGRDGE